MRRIYFAIPDASHARRIVSELQAAGIDRSRIHASARQGVDLTGLPGATEPQRGDRGRFLEGLFWNGNLALFAAAAAGLVIAGFAGSVPGAIGASVVMLATLAAGNWFSVRLPHAHIGDLRVPLEHGEVVLMVDVPKSRVREIEQRVSRCHPEAEVGGVGWTLQALGT
jgi:hypothetical protein